MVHFKSIRHIWTDRFSKNSLSPSLRMQMIKTSLDPHDRYCAPQQWMVWIELQNIKHAREATASLCWIRCSTMTSLSFYLIGRLKLAPCIRLRTTHWLRWAEPRSTTQVVRKIVYKFPSVYMFSSKHFASMQRTKIPKGWLMEALDKNSITTFMSSHSVSRIYWVTKGHTIGQHYISILYLLLPGNSIEIFPIHFSQLIPSILSCCEYQLFDVKFINKIDWARPQRALHKKLRRCMTNRL